MQYEEFIDECQEALAMEDRERVEGIVEAVLWTLSGRLEAAARDGVAAQLGGDEFKKPFQRRDEREIIPLDEFFNRVSARADLNLVQAQTYSKAVLEALHRALSEGEYFDMVEALPSEYAVWLGTEEERPEGPA